MSTSPQRRAVFVCCDGLGRNWISPRLTPSLAALAEHGLWCREHAAVFPSVTRVSAASIATGCHPARHGLHGNRMGLIEDGKIVVRDVGPPDFRAHLRRATGRTLHVPTLAQRVAADGAFIAYSNVSPGAAYFLDPDHHGEVYHRAGSFGRGGADLSGDAALRVSHDLAGDTEMTARFCREVLRERRPEIAVLWLANPDLTLHGAPLGSPLHLTALQETDRRVQEVVDTVAALRAQGEDILLLVGSDHGQETVARSIDVEAWLADAGLGALLASRDIGVAGQGTAALLYATELGRPSLLGVLGRLRQEPWVDELVVDDALSALGHSTAGGVVAAINTARLAVENAHGVAGQRWAVAERGKPDATGCGQHGGWGPDETRPFLILAAPSVGPGQIARPTSLVDIAPTILSFLGRPAAGLDGSAIVNFAASRSAGTARDSHALS